MCNSEPDVCLKCKEIVTFCECEETFTDTDDYIEHLENELVKALNKDK